MAEDFLTDDEQLENVKRWFSENGSWIVAGAAIGLAVFAGLRYYGTYKDDRGFKAATQFDAMTIAARNNDRKTAQNIDAALHAQYAGTPYADQADLLIAKLAIDAGELANAIEPLSRVMNESKDAELKHIARLRLARVLIDQGKSDAAIATLADATSTAFGANYHEVRGDAYLAKNDRAAALREYQAALSAADQRGVEPGLLELKITDLGATPKPDLNVSIGKAKS
jgi:predicted negative regulator of RcsB-dependent stress response